MSASQDHQSKNKLHITNDYSFLSKYSAAKLGYFDDPLLVKFVEQELKVKRGTRRTPLVNIGYANRVLLVEHEVIGHIKSDGVDCVIVLGSGFDTLSARHLNTGCHWIEIDLPQVIKTKTRYLALEWKLPMIEVQSDPDVITFKDKPLHLISCDIRFGSELSSKLSKVISSLENTKSFMILNEVCLNYLKTKEVQRVIWTIVDCIKEKALTLSYIGFEQVRPSEDDPFTKIMIDHFKSLGHPLKHIQTRSTLERLFIDKLEFDHLDIESIHKLYRTQERLISPELNFRFDMEPFDEFEELDMYMAHYALVKAEKTFGEKHGQRSEARLLKKFDALTINPKVEIKLDCIREQAVGSIRRYAHSACVIKDTLEEQSVLISGGFGSIYYGEQHRRLEKCTLMKRYGGAGPWQSRELSLSRPEVLADFETQNMTPTMQRRFKSLCSMHGQTCCVDSERKFVFFCSGRESPTKLNPYEPTCVAEIMSDNHIRIIHILDNSISTSSDSIEIEKGFPTSTYSNWWRHRIVRRSDDVVQLGGLTSRSDHWDAEMPVVTYHLNASSLGSTTKNLSSVEPRHSFGLDMRTDQTLLIYGGLLVGRRRDACFAPYLRCDTDTKAAQETLLYDFRLEQLALRAEEPCSSSYGMQVHFVNENQFVRVGGISTGSGLAEQSIDLFDLRRLDQGIVVKTPIEDKNNEILLCNTPSVKLESTKEIVTFGGGATCFTFGTHFNKSQIIYDYANLPQNDQ